MCKKYRLTKAVSIFSVIILTHSIANANGDDTGRLKETVTSMKASVVSTSCVDGAGWCPEYPDSLKLDRNEVITALKHEMLCGDGETLDSHDHLMSVDHLLEAGGVDAVSEAISHAVLSDTGLETHEIKLALEKLAHLDNSVAMQAYEEIYEHSEKLVNRQFEHAKMPKLSPAERKSLIQSQAADLRRTIVLVLRDNERVPANNLLERALDDSDLSVAVTAGRAILKRSKFPVTHKIQQRCANATKEQQKFCRLVM